MLVSRNTLVAISTALLAVVLAVSFYHPNRSTADEEAASRVVPDPGARQTSPSPTPEEQRAANAAHRLQQHVTEILARKEHLLRKRDETLARTEQIKHEMAQLEREFSQLESGLEQREMQSALEEVHVQRDPLLWERGGERRPRRERTLRYDGKTEPRTFGN